MPDGASWGATLRPGAIFGRFELLRELGRGGFGDRLGGPGPRPRSPGRVQGRAPGAPRRGWGEQDALREAETAASLAHPNLVTLFDVGRAEAGPYLVLELLRGETLAARLARGRLPPPEAVRVAVEVAQGGGARARERRRPPGSQAGERVPVRGRAGQGPRLRARARVRPAPPGRRDAGVHGAGAGQRGAGGRAGRRVRARGDAVRDALRRPAVRGATRPAARRAGARRP